MKTIIFLITMLAAAGCLEYDPSGEKLASLSANSNNRGGGLPDFTQVETSRLSKAMSGKKFKGDPTIKEMESWDYAEWADVFDYGLENDIKPYDCNGSSECKSLAVFSHLVEMMILLFELADGCARDFSYHENCAVILKEANKMIRDSIEGEKQYRAANQSYYK